MKVDELVEPSGKPAERLPVKPDAVRAWRKLIEKGDLASAEATLQVALASKPRDGTLLRCLSETRQRQGRITEAFQLGQRAVAAAPFDPNVLHHVGSMHLRFGNLVGAKGATQEVLRIAPNHVPSMLRMSEIALRQGDFDQAHAWADSVIETIPDNGSAYAARAAAHLARNELAYAAAALTEAMRLMPGDAQCIRQLEYLHCLMEP